jgi:hypothetical protein
MSQTIVASPPAPDAAGFTVTATELAAVWKESNAATVPGLAAIMVRVLSQIDGHLALRPTVLDVTDAVVGVVGKTIQPALDRLAAGQLAGAQHLATHDQQLGVIGGQIADLQKSLSLVGGDERTIATRLAHAEDHLRRVQEHQETLLRQQRELRDEVLTLVEVEFRERCRALASQHDEFARRLAVMEAARDARHDRAEEPQPATAGPRTTRQAPR